MDIVLLRYNFGNFVRNIHVVNDHVNVNNIDWNIQVSFLNAYVLFNIVVETLELAQVRYLMVG